MDWTKWELLRWGVDLMGIANVGRINTVGWNSSDLSHNNCIHFIKWEGILADGSIIIIFILLNNPRYLDVT